VGNLYFFGGLGIPKDMHEGFLWFQKSAEQQNVDSLSQLAEIYKTGQGTEMNLLQARYATDSARAIKRRKEIAGIAMNGKGAPLATMGNYLGYFLFGGSPGDGDLSDRITHEEAVLKFMSTGMTRVQAEEKFFHDFQADDLLTSLTWGSGCSGGGSSSQSGMSRSEQIHQDEARRSAESSCEDRKAATYARRVAYLRCAQAAVDSNAIERKCEYLP
jgi:TPR repeat protein